MGSLAVFSHRSKHYEENGFREMFGGSYQIRNRANKIFTIKNLASSGISQAP